MERLIDGQKYNGGKKNSVCLSAEGEQEVSSATPKLIVSFHGSPVLFSVLQGRPRSPSKTWNRESVGEGPGGGGGKGGGQTG